MDYQIYHADCFDVFPDIPDHSVDFILCDPPFGITARNKWDVALPFDRLWPEYWRIAKENACIAIFADGIFTSRLVLSQEKYWRYNWVWDKVLSTGFLNANRMPLRTHEDICIFYRKLPTYNPQKTPGRQNHSKGTKPIENTSSNYGAYNPVDNRELLGNMKHPTSILSFSKVHPSKALHPTEKPVALLEYLINTYSNPGDLILDNCMGVGSTGLACLNTGRRFIGIEKEEKYFDIAKGRLEQFYESRLAS